MFYYIWGHNFKVDMNKRKLYKHSLDVFVNKTEISRRDFDVRATNPVAGGYVTRQLPMKHPKIRTIEDWVENVASILSMDENTYKLYLYVAKIYRGEDVIRLDMTACSEAIGVSFPTYFACLKMMFFVGAMWPAHGKGNYYLNPIYFIPNKIFRVSYKFDVDVSDYQSSLQQNYASRDKLV